MDLRQFGRFYKTLPDRLMKAAVTGVQKAAKKAVVPILKNQTINTPRPAWNVNNGGAVAFGKYLRGWNMKSVKFTSTGASIENNTPAAAPIEAGRGAGLTQPPAAPIEAWVKKKLMIGAFSPTKKAISEKILTHLKSGNITADQAFSAIKAAGADPAKAAQLLRSAIRANKATAPKPPRIKNSTTKPNSLAVRQLAFVIARAIKQRGLHPRMIMNDALPESTIAVMRYVQAHIWQALVGNRDFIID